LLAAPCPNCGAEIRFRSVALPVRVCDFCRSTVLRRGDTLEAVGRVAVVPDDVSPLQLSTTGRYARQDFEIIGRVRWRWSGGAWSEWLLQSGDGSCAWLGEAAGRFMLLFPARQALPTDLANAVRDGRIIAGTEATIDDLTYRVNDAREVTCIGGEGELPFSVSRGLGATSVDLLRDDGSCASVQTEGDEVAAYVGRYVTLAELRPRNLRRFEDWALPEFAR
jgi:hypothetical protein